MSKQHSVLAIDTGATTTRILSKEGMTRRLPTPQNYDDYLQLVQQAAAEIKATKITIGVPAIVNAHSTILVAANLGDGWTNRNLASDLGQATGAGVVVLQDTEAAGYALQSEICGDDDAMLVTLSSGVGGAWVNKEFVKPLELGHIPLNLSGNSRVCVCKQTGCVEADIGGVAVQRIYGTTAEHISDPKFWDDYGTKVGQFFLCITTLFRLKQIALMGGISQKWDLFRDPCLKYLNTHLKYVPLPEIRLMEDADNLGARGAYYLGTSEAQ